MSGINIVAYQVADSINVKNFRREFKGELLQSSSYELFYKTSDDSYMLVPDYGVVIFANYESLEISKMLQFLEQFSLNPIDTNKYSDEFIIYEGSTTLQFGYNSIKVPKVDKDIIQMTMLHVGQSVALDYYADVTQALLDDTTTLTDKLEKTGKFTIPKKKLLIFLGKSMNIKKRIIDNIYILDLPDSVWENESLNKLNNGIREVFDIRSRFKNLDYQLKIVEDNLHLFTELLQHNESKNLEWIIIGLILFEVVQVIFTDIFK